MTQRTDSSTWESIVVPAVSGDVHARVFRPAGPRRGWLVWAHGGSWVRGSVDSWHPACEDLARAAGCTVVSVEYRLAPRHVHPAALIDVLTALDWAACQAEQEDTGVAVGGDSAGGTIAASAAMTWRDLGRPLAAQVLAYPPLDPSCRAESYTRHRGGFPSRADMLSAWRDYRGGDHHSSSAYSTPFEAEDFAGTAPAVLAVGALDPVADDVRAYATHLRTAGGRVEMREFPDLGHGSFLLPADEIAPRDSLRQWLGESFRDLLAESDVKENP
ncbi:alpha/beta hydrolase [Umezawaea sp. Da 62-37]|uniref:alpha/beta hydrolase n=1 Tax=Umezawaea sp. Da 62-37 TaxID=3075927 RepID=UPI0028F74CC6|nr:alpha/beta hydrolase [Umezawaea sp. Da 62-37]WNV84621.1 alpha/beta hydrolase [Umezawaea sp. Da 62-37]